jgi:hypothetical protein
MRSGPPHSQINILMPFPFSMCTLVRRTMRRLCLCECPCVCYLPGTLHASRHQQEAAASVFRNSKDECAGDFVTTQKQASARQYAIYTRLNFLLFFKIALVPLGMKKLPSTCFHWKSSQHINSQRLFPVSKSHRERGF